MYVCLMRHGKAEPYHDGMDDKKRELIEKGKKQAAAMLDAARLWWPEGTTVLWASPYIRTCQTAACAGATGMSCALSAIRPI